MILPDTLKNITEWVFVGPMGPHTPDHLRNFPTICVDGGAHFSENMHIWIGDNDSLMIDKIESPHIFKLPIEKDQSDLGHAFNLFQESRYYKFHLWGFLGGRRDHELFNLGESFNFLERHQESQMMFYGENGQLLYHILGAGQWKFAHKGIFSLGTLKKTSVKLTGEVKYSIPRHEVLYPLSSLGLSNVGEGEILLETRGPVFIYFPEGK